MVSKKIQTDEKCCGMKSVSGYCPKPLESASDYLSKKWTMSIIITIGNFGCLRFNDLLGRMEGATAKILSDRLKELEGEGVVKRTVFNETPPRVEYELTRSGIKLMNILTPLINWVENKRKKEEL